MSEITSAECVVRGFYRMGDASYTWLLVRWLCLLVCLGLFVILLVRGHHWYYHIFPLALAEWASKQRKQIVSRRRPDSIEDVTQIERLAPGHDPRVIEYVTLRDEDGCLTEYLIRIVFRYRFVPFGSTRDCEIVIHGSWLVSSPGAIESVLDPWDGLA